MVVKQPIIPNRVDRASRVAICIDLLCTDASGEEIQVGSGTGFVHQHNGQDFFVSCWHVIAGRDPKEPGQLLSGYPASPSAFRLHIATAKNPNHFVPSDSFPLYSSGKKPLWVQAPFDHNDSRVDLIALAFNFGDKPLIVRIEEFLSPQGQTLRAGKDVVIVGYPFGIRWENPFPTWKRAFIASEPSILLGGQMKYHIDTPGRPGMSGSPVFMLSGKQPYANDEKSLTFAGVYSGSVRDDKMFQMNLGVAWHAAMVETLFSKPINGENPFPP